MRKKVANEIDQSNDTPYLNNKHHRVLHHRARIQLPHRIDCGSANDLRVPEGASFLS